MVRDPLTDIQYLLHVSPNCDSTTRHTASGELKTAPQSEDGHRDYAEGSATSVARIPAIESRMACAVVGCARRIMG